MSIWPFAHRASAKPKPSAPPPAPTRAQAQAQPRAHAHANAQAQAQAQASARDGTSDASNDEGEKKIIPAQLPSGGGVTSKKSASTARRSSARLRKSPSPPLNDKDDDAAGRATTTTRRSKRSASKKTDAIPPTTATTTKPTKSNSRKAGHKDTDLITDSSRPAPAAGISSTHDPMDIDRPRRASQGSSTGNEGALPITALPGSKALQTSPHLRAVGHGTADIPYAWNLPPSAQYQQRRKLQRNPSRNKRSAPLHESTLARRRSSKKRRNDALREEEIRAMSAPIDVPKRATTDTGLLRRESRKARGALNRNLERPESTVSLPFAESMHSSMSGEAEQRNYRLSVLDVMSPRPAIRWRDAASRTHAPHDAPTANLLRKASRSEKPSGPARTARVPPKEKEQKERTRIDSLADEMDSTELRDILERDRKRKERKQDRDAERLKRKLERRAEKQRMKEWLAQQEGDQSAPEEIRDALGIDGTLQKEGEARHVHEEPDFHMEDVDAGVATTTTTKQADPMEDLSAASKEEVQVYHDPEKTPIPLEDIHPAFRAEYQAAVGIPVQQPTQQQDDEKQALRQEEEAHPDLATPMSEVRTPMETPNVETAQAVSYTTARPTTPLTPVTSSVYHGDRVKASKILGTDVAGGSYTVSNTALQTAASATATQPKDTTPPSKQLTLSTTEQTTSTASKKEPETPISPSKKRSGFFASWFRGRRRSSVGQSPREPPTPDASFSNASREEMSRNLPAHLVQQPSSATSGPYFKKTGPPLRTTSIFREDLPESPLSPPDSRVQSPVEGGVAGSAKNGSRRASARRANIPSAILSENTSSRVDSPEIDDGEKTPTSPISAKASALMSQSLASVDSEASWLSGRSPRSASRAMKHGSGSLGRREDFQGSYEELGVPEDEYFRRLNAPARSRGASRASNLSAAIAGSRGESSVAPTEAEGNVVAHAGAGRQPTVIQRDGRHKSSEGLLNTYLSSPSTTTGGAEEEAEKTPEGKYPTPAGTPTEDRSSEEITPVQRATSVNVGKGHARNVSAGSAKLLDIPRRGSASLSSVGTPNPPSSPQRSQSNLGMGREGSSSPMAQA